MLGNAKELLTGSPTLPIRNGKRPVTFRGPLHVQCSNHGDDRLLRQLVEEVVAWPRMRRRPPQKELYLPRPTLGELYYGAYQRNSDHEILSSPFEERTAKALSGTL